MIYSLVTAFGMIIGAVFAVEAVKTLKVNASLLPMALMIAWDGIWIYAMYGYMEKRELAVGIMFGTILKVFYLIKIKLWDV